MPPTAAVPGPASNLRRLVDIKGPSSPQDDPEVSGTSVLRAFLAPQTTYWHAPEIAGAISDFLLT
jgi:hypothetical protein